MLKTAPKPHRPDDEPLRFEGTSGGTNLSDSFKSFTTLVRRHLPIFLIVIPCALTLGLLYLLTTPPSYTAIARMIIDTRKVPAFEKQQQTDGGSIIDTVAVATQVEILTSENVSKAVIKDLKLTEDPEFVGQGGGLIGVLLKPIATLIDWGSSEAVSETELNRRTLEAFERRRKITRVPQTYVMEIKFRAHDPDRAAQIANAISDAYVVDQLEAKYQSTKRASKWLEERIHDLRADSLGSIKALIDFKEKNNIIEASGKMMNEQQMSEVTSQLILAHAATAEAKARLDRIGKVMVEGIPDASVADALHSEVIIRLRNDYLTLAGKESIWSKKYGADHLATVALRNQMAELRRNVMDETAKIAGSYKSEYEIAMAREASIQKSLENAISDSRLTHQAQVSLSELESNASTSKNMFENFLLRYTEAVQEQSFPISEARLITPADPPATRSEPNTILTIAVTGVGGLMLAFGLAAWRESTDRVFRSGGQVEEALRVKCIAMLPLVKALAEKLPDETESAETNIAERRIGKSVNILRYVVQEPFSQFSEALRSLKVMVDLNGVVTSNRVIGLTSSLPAEGKSTIASNFASMIAHAGSKVMLVDGDLRNPRLSRIFAPEAPAGLVEVVSGQTALQDAVWTDPVTGLVFLPGGPQCTKLMHPNEILGSAAVKALFEHLREEYDYVIADFPPLSPVVDTRTTTTYIDSYIYIAEWGRTKIDVVEHCLSNAPEVYDRLLGVVLNKADMSVLKRYELYRTDYYYKKYSQYKTVA